MISKLIFAGYTGSKNQVWTWKKSSLIRNRFFFLVYNKLPNWHFKNQAQIDNAYVFILISTLCFIKIWSLKIIGSNPLTPALWQEPSACRKGGMETSGHQFMRFMLPSLMTCFTLNYVLEPVQLGGINLHFWKLPVNSKCFEK